MRIVAALLALTAALALGSATSASRSAGHGYAIATPAQFGPAGFGATSAEVVNLLGKPTLHNPDIGNHTVLAFGKRQFDFDSDRLTYFQSSDPRDHIGPVHVGLSVARLKSLFPRARLTDQYCGEGSVDWYTLKATATTRLVAYVEKRVVTSLGARRKVDDRVC